MVSFHVKDVLNNHYNIKYPHTKLALRMRARVCYGANLTVTIRIVPFQPENFNVPGHFYAQNTSNLRVNA